MLKPPERVRLEAAREWLRKFERDEDYDDLFPLLNALDVLVVIIDEALES